MGHQDRTAERLLDRIATRHHGIVTRREALRAGVTQKQIRHRLASGLLISAHPGVYRLGHRAPNILATYLAAVLACGEGAMLGGRAAAYFSA